MSDISPVHHLVDPGLNYLFTRNYNLSIRMLPDGFSYTVFDATKNRFMALAEFAFPFLSASLPVYGSDQYLQWVEKIISQHILLKEDFNKVSVLVGGNKYTLMPPPLFNPENARKYLAFNHPLSQEDEVRFDEIHAPESVLIYGFAGSINSWINHHYPDATIFHQCSPLLRSMHIQNKSGNHIATVMANIRSDILDIIAFKGASLHLCNSFSYFTDTDLLYYLLFVMEQLKINTDEASLLLCGAVDENSGLFNLLKTYVRFAGIVPETQAYPYPPSFNSDLLQHRYHDLLNISLCG